MIIKSYSEMLEFKSFEDRVKYLQTYSRVGEETFGSKRYLNQLLYHSRKWRDIKREIIIRDSDGDYPLDLAHEDYPIMDTVYIHHINPITVDDVIAQNRKVFDPENLICVSFRTHQAIHYGNEIDLFRKPVERKPGDTNLW